MTSKNHPIKADFSRAAAIDTYQFIADASRTLTIEAFNEEGQFIERLALAVTTTAQTAKQLVEAQSGDISRHWAWHVVSISAGTIYGLPVAPRKNATPGAAITTTTGKSLTALDKLGPWPGSGAVIQSIEPSESITAVVDTSLLATAAHQVTAQTALDAIKTATELLDNIVSGSEAQVDVVGALPTGSNVIGGTMPPLRYIDVTPTVETTALDNGDILFDATAIANAVLANDGLSRLCSVQVIDKADQKAEFNLVFLSANVSLGSLDAAPSISDANALNFLGHVKIAAGAFASGDGWLDLGGVSVAKKGMSDINGPPFELKPASGTRIVYVACFIGATTPTYSAGDVVLRLGIQDGVVGA